MSNDDTQAVLSRHARPESPVQGQFCIGVPGVPYGPRPGADDNVAFLAEIDVIWLHQRNWADRIMERYVELGGTHVLTGPVYADGYASEPDTDWLSDLPGFVRFWRWLGSYVPHVTLVVAPDNRPFYMGGDGRPGTFDWGQMQRLTEFYRRLRQEIAIPRVMSQWEQYGRVADMRVLFQWMRACFPDALRVWHSPPGHLSPGSSDEEDRATWVSAAECGIHGLYLQAAPPHAYSVNEFGRTPIAQMRYDCWDMVRRFRGIDSPWGDPIIGEDGNPLRVWYAEGTAASIYNAHYADIIGDAWGRQALSVDGVEASLDGIVR